MCVRVCVCDSVMCESVCVCDSESVSVMESSLVVDGGWWGMCVCESVRV